MPDDLFGGSKHEGHSGHNGDDQNHVGYGDERLELCNEVKSLIHREQYKRILIIKEIGEKLYE